MKNSIYKDFRLCIVAGALWAAALICHMRPGLIPGFAIFCGAGIAAGSVTVRLCAGKVSRLRPGILVNAGLYCIVCSVAGLCMAVSICAYENAGQPDISVFGTFGAHGRHGTFNAPGTSGILGTLSAPGGTHTHGSEDTSSAPVSVFVRAESPMTASDRRSFDCKIDAHITHVADAGGVLSAVSLPVRLYAKGGSCIFENHGYFAVTGAISRAQYGKVPYWISAGSRAGGPGAASAEISVKLVEKPKLWFRYINRMQNAFIAQTQRLSPQGRILVPGLTLGVMGNESFLADNTSASGKVSGNGVRGSGAVPERQTGIGNAGPPSIPSAYISRIKNSFLNLGIMHLMAVSGSHFALIAVFLRWILVRLHAHRKTVAGMTACGYYVLYMFMYPFRLHSKGSGYGDAGDTCIIRRHPEKCIFTVKPYGHNGPAYLPILCMELRIRLILFRCLWDIPFPSRPVRDTVTVYPQGWRTVCIPYCLCPAAEPSGKYPHNAVDTCTVCGCEPCRCAVRIMRNSIWHNRVHNVYCMAFLIFRLCVARFGVYPGNECCIPMDVGQSVVRGAVAFGDKRCDGFSCGI